MTNLPPKGECPAGTGQDAKLNTDSSDFPTVDQSSKALVTIKAKFALCGHAVHDGENCDFIVIRNDWGQSRYCSDYAALIGFGRQIGVLQ